MQGTVLSWNNFCYQTSLIVSPLILSAIYIKNRDAIYYFSSIFAAIGFVVMACLACRKDYKVIGKVSMFAEEKKDVEMVEKKVDEDDNSAVAADSIPDVDPTVTVPVVTAPATVSTTVPTMAPAESSVTPVPSVAVASDSMSATQPTEATPAPMATTPEITVNPSLSFVCWIY